jgi:hypothetical protein
MKSERRRSVSSPDLALGAHQSEHARPAPQGEPRTVSPASEVRELPLIPDAAPAITTAFEARLARWLADVARNGPRAA